MGCSTPDSSHYAGCACYEEHRQDQVARLTRERDEARERAAGLSRELLDAMQARDSYRASAEIRVGMRREFEALLGCGDTMGDEAFERGLARLRELVEAESRAARLDKEQEERGRQYGLRVQAETEVAEGHRTLRRCEVPEQIPPFKTPLAPLAARIFYLREKRDAAVAEAERLTRLVQGWYEGRARIGAHMTFVDQRFYDSVRCERTGWPGDDADGDGGPPEE